MRGSTRRAAASIARHSSVFSATSCDSYPASKMRRSPSVAIGAVANEIASSGLVTRAFAIARSTHSAIPMGDRSLVYANPTRRSSSTRTPRPRSVSTSADSTLPSMISMLVPCESRRYASASTPSRRFASSSARSTTASLSRRSVMSVGSRLALAHDSANDYLRNADRRLGVGHRRPLAILAAGADGEAEIRADHVDGVHHRRRVPGERRAADRLRDRPATDLVALADLEREVPAHRVDLPAAHLAHEHAALDGANDLLRLGLARRDHRRGHARNRQVPERLPPRVAGERQVYLLRVLPVSEVAPQDPVLDEDVLPRRRAFVVDRARAAPSGEAAVVDDRHEFARHPLPKLSRVHREAAIVEVGLEAVPDGLVNERAARLARHDDGVRPCRS